MGERVREEIALFGLLLVTLALIWLAYGVATQYLRKTYAWMHPTLEWNLMLWLLLALIYATGWQHWFGTEEPHRVFPVALALSALGFLGAWWSGRRK